VILLDTHLLLWLDRDDVNLGARAREASFQAWQAGCVAVSAISFWEAALLHQRGRIDLRRPASQWRSDWLVAGLLELPLDGATALLGADLNGFHADPADRCIAATAVRHRACLLTADRAILAWPGTLERLSADT